mmetsp:Transcript_15871/g.43285  ORF Transcript_15871/g.43285 Transcript_15871/m.43285 type:complete len:145 (-) Transcript_15871:284-718(-)
MARAKLISPSDVALSSSDQLQATRSACPIDPARDVETATEVHLDDRPSLTTGRPLEKLCLASSTSTSLMRRQCWSTSSGPCKSLGTRLLIVSSTKESERPMEARWSRRTTICRVANSTSVLVDLFVPMKKLGWEARDLQQHGRE